jgi:predicted lipoprotein
MLLEVLIGFTLFAVVVLATGTGTMFTTVAASAAQQRSVAYSLVSADIANVTALPFADLTAGLNHTTDSLGSDPNIQTVGATYVLRLTGATLATSNANTSESPLVPHISTTTLGATYKVATYPQAISSGTVTVVVIVTWHSALGGTGQVVGQTQVAAP